MLKKHLQKILLLFIALTFTSLQATTGYIPDNDIPDKSDDDDYHYIMPQVEKEPVDNSLSSEDLEDLEDKKNIKDKDIEREIKIIQDQKDYLTEQVMALMDKNIRLEKEKKRNCTLCSILLPTVLAISSGVQYLFYNPLQKSYNALAHDYNILNDSYNSLNGSYNAIEHDYNICKNASNEILNAFAKKYNISTTTFTWDLELPQHLDQ